MTVPGYWEVALYVFLLASFLGLEVIRRVPPLLHTPLMSLTNAISGIALVGSLVIAGGEHSPLAMWLGLVAVTASSINVVGGFLITDRMLRMVRRRQPPRRPEGTAADPDGRDVRQAAGPR
jgi:NAD(P) transhydrogenase subunit alpha